MKARDLSKIFRFFHLERRKEDRESYSKMPLTDSVVEEKQTKLLVDCHF